MRNTVILTMAIAAGLAGSLTSGARAQETTPAPALDAELAALRDAEPEGRDARIRALLARKVSISDVVTAVTAGLPAPQTKVGWQQCEGTDANGVKRPYHLYVPENVAKMATAGDETAPLIVDMHGGVSRPEYIDAPNIGSLWVSLADEHGLVIARPLGRKDCVWWTDAGAAHVRATIRDVRRRAPIDDNRVFGTGFSDGGSGAFHLAMASPDPFAGLLPMNGHPGVAIGNAGRQHYLTNARMTPLFVTMTQDDGLYPAKSVLPHVQGLMDAGTSVHLVSYPRGGHRPSYFEDQSTAFASFVNEAEREPLPDQLQWSASHVETGAVRWIAIEAIGSSSVESEFKDEPSVLSRPGRVILGFQIARSEEKRGVLVGPVRPNSPAQSMGLKEGAVIVAVNDIPTPNTATLRGVLGRTEWGTTIAVTVQGDAAGDAMKLTHTLPPFVPQTAYPRTHPTATVRVNKKGNTVELAARNVRKLRLRLAPGHFDLTKDVVVTVDGKEIQRTKPVASVETLLRSFAADADSGRLFAAEITIELPAPAEESDKK